MANALALSVFVELTLGTDPFWTSNPKAFCDLFQFEHFSKSCLNRIEEQIFDLALNFKTAYSVFDS